MKRFERFLGKAFFVNVFSNAIYLHRHGHIDLNAYILISVGSIFGLFIYEIVKNMIISGMQSKDKTSN
jgi:hypothetical protein